MKRPQVDFIIPSMENEAEGMILHFDSVEDIDSVIESLQEARAELEHLIEMKRIRNHNKRVRRNLRKKFGSDIDLDVLKVRDKIKTEELVVPKIRPIHTYEDLLKKFDKKDDIVDDVLKELAEFDKLSEEEKVKKIFDDYEKLDKATKELLKPIINGLKVIVKAINE